jgi:hypothetical protein
MERWHAKMTAKQEKRNKKAADKAEVKTAVEEADPEKEEEIPPSSIVEPIVPEWNRNRAIRTEKAARQKQIIKLWDDGIRSPKVLAQRFDVSEATIRSDKKELTERKELNVGLPKKTAA